MCDKMIANKIGKKKMRADYLSSAAKSK